MITKPTREQRDTWFTDICATYEEGPPECGPGPWLLLLDEIFSAGVAAALDGAETEWATRTGSRLQEERGDSHQTAEEKARHSARFHRGVLRTESEVVRRYVTPWRPA